MLINFLVVNMPLEYDAMKRDPKVFISYSWESAEHQDRVLALADWLEVNGVEVIFDQYDPNPSKPWPQWMDDGIKAADFVICVCTESYRKRVENREVAGVGLGVQWEGNLIQNALAAQDVPVGKFQIFQFEEQRIDCIPTALQGNNRHVVRSLDLGDNGLENLYRIITDQPKALRPTRGEIAILPQVERLQVPRSGRQAPDPELTLSVRRLKSHEQRDFELVPSNKRIQAVGGKGSYVERLAIAAWRLAREAERLDDYPEAASLALRSYEIDKSNTASLILLATCLYHMQDYAKAEAYYAELLETRSAPPLAEYRLLTCKYFQGMASDPYEDLKAIFKRRGHTSGNAIDFSYMLSDLGRYDEACSVLEQFNVGRQSVQLVSQLAVYTWYTGNVNRAVELLESIPRNEYDVTIWSNLGVGLAEQKRFGLAIEALNTALSSSPRYKFAWYALAEIYALMNDAEPAVAKLQDLLDCKSVHLYRIKGERTFDGIRDTDVFKSFLERLEVNMPGVLSAKGHFSH